MLLDEYYRADPELRDVWIALPGTVRAQILQWDARVTTKGELQKLAEGFVDESADFLDDLRAVHPAVRALFAPVRSAPFSGRSAGLFWKREPAGRPALSFCGEKQ